ncbi:MAG: winged helix-turn-helix transcriptional regulator [Flavobacteriales bacterium]|nr:winged helix-turn-helix transcriptional regulator [Flavobacteriales bacterium]
MRPEQTIDFHMRRAWQQMANLYNKEASQYGGTMSIGYILLNIEKEGTPSTSLGPKMGMKATSLARSLKVLEAEKLIFRRTDKEDKRKVLVFLTPQGKKYRDRSKEAVLNMNKMLMADIDKNKLKTFFEVLDQFNCTLDKTDCLTNTNEKTH